MRRSIEICAYIIFKHLSAKRCYIYCWRKLNSLRFRQTQKTFFFKCPRERTTRHNDQCLDLLNSIWKPVHFFRFCTIQSKLHFYTFICKKCYIDCGRKLHFNKIKEIWGCILEALMKNLHLFIPQFLGFDETLKSEKFQDVY